MSVPNLSPNFEDRFSKIEIKKVSPDLSRNKDGLTVPQTPNLSTTKRAETRNISRSNSSVNLSSQLHISKTPSRSVGSRSVSKEWKPSKDTRSGGPSYSYMRETSSSSRKSTNPFASPSVKDPQLKPGPRRVLSTHSNELMNFMKLPKTPSKRHVSQPYATNSTVDVYTRLYNDSKGKIPPVSRQRSMTFDEKITIKVTDLQQLYQIIYDEDPSLFEDTDNTEYHVNTPHTPQEYTQDESTNPLDIYERGELLRRKDIYFLPTTEPSRNINIRNYNTNYGFDDTQGNYVIVPNDHINFRYQILSTLGNGTFGNVVKCVDKKYTSKENGLNKVVAIKIIKNDLNWSLQAVYEIKMLKHLNSGNIANLDPYLNEYGRKCPVLTYYDHFHFRGHMCIVTEPLSLNLYSLLEITKFQGLSLSLIQTFLRQILNGLQYIHTKNLIHCDIKPENIMIKLPPRPEDHQFLSLKIIDFGSSCFTNEVSYSYIQSRFYRAPEVIIGAKYDQKIDIWSIGCIIAELFTGDPLLPGKNELEQIGLILEYFGNPSSSLILDQRNQILKSIKERKSVNNFTEEMSKNANVLQVGLADEKSIKKTLLYTLFDIEGKINLQFLNMRINGGTMSNSLARKNYKVSSRNLEVRLRLKSCDEDKRLAMLFVRILNRIFKWDPGERASVDELITDPFLG